MKILGVCISVEMGLFLTVMLAIISYQLLTGKINAGGLLFKKIGPRHYNPLGVQLLLLTLMTAMYQLLLVMKDPTHFPSIPEEALLVLGGGNLAFLGGKFHSLLSHSKRESFGRAKKARRKKG
jgi:hypothetical protein